MKRLEEDLRSALARRTAPEGFAERVSARATRHERRQYPRWLAVAAAVVLMLASVMEHQRRRRVEAESASRELVRAMEIVNSRLDHARERVIQMGDSQWDLERKSLRP